MAVVVSQLANIVYEKLNAGEDVVVVIFPSLLLLSLLTIPSLIIGFRLGKSVGLSLNKPHTSYTRNAGHHPALFAVVSGLIFGFLLLVVRYFSWPHLPDEIPEFGFRGLVGGLLVSIWAAIGEEVWFRSFA